MKTRELQQTLEREVSSWPGVETRWGQRRKHRSLELFYEGRSRFVTVAKTPSDHRGVKNHIATVRQTLTGLGASRHG